MKRPKPEALRAAAEWLRAFHDNNGDASVPERVMAELGLPFTAEDKKMVEDIVSVSQWLTVLARDAEIDSLARARFKTFGQTPTRRQLKLVRQQILERTRK